MVITSVVLGFFTYVKPMGVLSNEMPTGGQVKSGNVTITGTGTNHMIIDSKSQKSIINWNSFSIHKKGRVDFNQPSANSFSLNRVQGSTPSTIAGQLNSNGKVMLVNPNGVVITPSGVVNTRSFTASTLNIKDEDFMNGRYNFEGNGSSNGVRNAGKITIGGGGHAALLGGYVSNSGVVNAKLGKIAMGAGEKITLDFVGDGLMTVSVPSHKLGIIRDINGKTLKSLISNSGILKANGGIIKLSATTARNLTRSAVNVGSTGSIIAQTVRSKPGKVVIGSPSSNSVRIAGNIDVSAPKTSFSPSGKVVITGRNVVHSGNIYASGYEGGKVNVISKESIKLEGSILAKGNDAKGGKVIIMSENAIETTPKNVIDVSGQYNGGEIRTIAKKSNKISGKLIANSSQIGGKVDITAEKVEVESAKIEAKGNLQGGKIRVGGDYLGGNLTNLDKNIKQGFVSNALATNHN